MKKIIGCIMICCALAINCSNPEVAKTRFNDSEMREFILNHVKFNEALSAVNALAGEINVKFSQLDDLKRSQIRQVLANSKGNSDRLLGNQEANDSDILQKLSDLSGINFNSKLRSVSEPLQILFNDVKGREADLNQVKRIYESLLHPSSEEKKLLSGRVGGYDACVNNAYYCASIEFSSCTSSTIKDICITIADIGLTVDLIKCEQQYLW